MDYLRDTIQFAISTTIAFGIVLTLMYGLSEGRYTFAEWYVATAAVNPWRSKPGLLPPR